VLRKAVDAGLPRAKLIFADHPLVPVNLTFDSIEGSIPLSEEQANDLIPALGRMLDTSIREKLHSLADAVFVL
jgi:hypothetical protein